MRKIFATAVVGTLAAIVSLPASAQSLRDLVNQASADQFSGFYAGVGGGYGFGNSDIGFTNSPARSTTVTTQGPEVCQQTSFAGNTFTGSLVDLTNVSRVPAGMGALAFGADIFSVIGPIDAFGIPVNRVAQLDGTGTCTFISSVISSGQGFATLLGRTNGGTVVPGVITTTPGVQEFVGPLSAGFADSTTISGVAALAGTSDSSRIDGAFGEVFGGYGVTLNRFHVGVEGSYSFGSLDDKESIGLFSYKPELERMGAVRVRVGMPMDNFMPYVTAGVAFGQGNLTYSLGNVSVDDDQFHVGGTVGAGVEYAATENLFLRLEYSYTHLPSETYLSEFGYDAKQEFDINKVSFALVFRR